MPYFNIVAETNQNTVVTEYEPVKARSENYESEAALEKEFIRLLGEQGYTDPQIVGEQQQKDFVILFGAILRMRNLLTSFDEFKDCFSERELQDYLGKYQDLRDEWVRKRESTDITGDIVFEIELIKQIEINIDYILMLIKKYHEHEDKELLITIGKAVDASPELRSKKQLIETFIAEINGVADVGDVMEEWNAYVFKRREADLSRIIQEERLKTEETRKFIENAFREGEVRTTGTGIDKLMPPVSRFGGNRAQKKQNIIDKLKGFFEKYFGIMGGRS